ncbi:hypothetical protein [Streptomyces sp. NPDC092129]|uniref:hypothetical protein n=1 Tax=Streptomyces sp. NPDC092129 TaxID=3366010 RepID=UPI0038026B9A
MTTPPAPSPTGSIPRRTSPGIWSPYPAAASPAPSSRRTPAHAATDGAYALYTNTDSDRQIIDEVGAIAAARGRTRAQTPWLGCAAVPLSRPPSSVPAPSSRSTTP